MGARRQDDPLDRALIQDMMKEHHSKGYGAMDKKAQMAEADRLAAEYQLVGNVRCLSELWALHAPAFVHLSNMFASDKRLCEVAGVACEAIERAAALYDVNVKCSFYTYWRTHYRGRMAYVRKRDQLVPVSNKGEQVSHSYESDEVLLGTHDCEDINLGQFMSENDPFSIE